MSEAEATSNPSETGPSDTPPQRYTAQLAGQIEVRWQAWWDEHDTFRQPNPGEDGFDPDKPKFYCLDMFPYPSGAGLHVGHPEGYTATDILCRYKRMQGFNVLHPMGWDAFGLPAEQYAIQTGVHPAQTTRTAIDNFRRQLKRFGFSYDWSREFATIDEDYYRWTQWIFLKLYNAWFDERVNAARPIQTLIDGLESGNLRIGPEGDLAYADAGASGVGLLAHDAPGVRLWHELDAGEMRAFIDERRLAYIGEQTVNWCPKLGTALANEEVIDGKSERGGYPVVRAPLRQWMFRITAYCDRLLKGLDGLDWPNSTKTMQGEWIGRSEGAEIEFALDVEGADPNVDADVPQMLEVFTTRPDTVFGATYMVVAPEHPLVSAVMVTPRPETPAAELGAYVEAARSRSDVERQESKDKTGVFTGLYAINPANNARIPIWTSDYVLMGYGSGAIMAVPAQDQRDWDFAKAFDLPIVRTVQPPAQWDGEAFTGEGPAINSDFLDGMLIDQAKASIIAWLEEKGVGRRRVNYRLRDWLFSRQRYWGEPFPIVHDDHGEHHGVDEEALPVRLPALADYQPIESDTPVPLLGKATEWVRTTAGEAGVGEMDPDAPVMRETNTMPGWAGSCWYYLRYCDPKNQDRFVGEEAEKYWMDGGVDLYIGGAEHAVLHLLYARFWHQVLFDLGEVATPEPFTKLFHQGLITSHAYQRADKTLVAIDEVDEASEGVFVERGTGENVSQVIAKMSKSLKNVVNPDDVIAEHGADVFRLYEMYMGPLEASKPWNTRDIVGLSRFLARAWRLCVDEQTGQLVTAESANEAIERALHKTIAKVGGDIERLSFNTAIAAMIEFVNEAGKAGGLTRDQMDRFVRVLAPFAPHVGEELWSRLEMAPPVSLAEWPRYDEAMLTEDSVEIAVQINGKVRHRMSVPADADKARLEEIAMGDERVAELIEGKTVRKVIAVPGRMVNIVAN